MKIITSTFKLFQFGCPFIQKFYMNLCSECEISFFDFQKKITEDTGYTYDQLKSFWITGEEINLTNFDFNELDKTWVDNYLIIHFDKEKKEILGITNHDYLCYSDSYFYYEKL